MEFGGREVIYRRKEIPTAMLTTLVRRYDAAHAALQAPRGAALLRSPLGDVQVTIKLTQDYCDVFEQVSPGGRESAFDPDLSDWELLAGDPTAVRSENNN